MVESKQSARGFNSRLREEATFGGYGILREKEFQLTPP